MLHAYASPSKSTTAKFVFSFAVFIALSDSTSAIIDSAIGSIIIAVAVLLTHMLRNAAAIMNPIIIDFGFVPTNLRMFNAILLWRFVRSIASAIMNPPMNKYIKGFAKGVVASATELTFSIGNRTIGSSAVAGIGIASVTHHVAISTPTAATLHPETLSPSGGGIISIIKKIKNPIVSPSLCLQKKLRKTPLINLFLPRAFLAIEPGILLFKYFTKNE